MADSTLVDLSNQRNTSGSLDSQKVEAYAASAAVYVKSKLGSTVDGGDEFAVSTGAILALMFSASVYSLALTEPALRAIDSAKSDLEAEAKARRRGAAGIAHSRHAQADGTMKELDKRYPQERWDD